MPSGMSGSDNSIAESLPPPPNLGRGRLIAPFRIGANAPNQNSAGKYPLISRPMQISTRVGVVQAIGRPPEFLKQAQSNARQARAQAPARGSASDVRCKRGAKEKPDPCGSGYSLSARGPTITFQRGTADGATIAIWEDGQPPAASERQYAAAIPSHNAKACMPAMRQPVKPNSGSRPAAAQAGASALKSASAAPWRRESRGTPAPARPS